MKGLLGTAVDEGDWTKQMQRRRPAEGQIDPDMLVLPPDQGTLYYTPQDISPQWDKDMDAVARALRALGAV